VKLYIPFLISMLFLFLVSAKVSHMPVSFRYLLDLLSFGRVDNTKGAWKVVIGSLWFLPVFFLAVLTTPILARVTGNRGRLTLLGGLALAYAGTWLYSKPLATAPRLLSTSWHVLFFFVFFYALGMYSAGWRLRGTWLAGSVACLAAVLAWYFLPIPASGTVNMVFHKFRHDGPYAAYSLLGVLAVLWGKRFAGWTAARAPHGGLGRFLLYSGRESYAIYLYQGFGGSILPRPVEQMKALGWNWHLILPVAFLLNLGITCLLTIVFSRVNAAAVGWLPGEEGGRRHVGGEAPDGSR
jgi:hypothetical protein